MTDPNDLAYPKVVSSPARDRNHGPYTDTHSTGGLTKREMFAAMMFQQFLAGSVLPPGFDASEQLRFAAQRAIESADALIAELNKEAP